MRYPSLLFPAIVAIAISSGACNSSKTNSTTSREKAVAPNTEAPATPAANVADNAPAAANVSELVSVEKPAGEKVATNFTWKGSDGVEHSLKEYRGKTVMLNFWATWCPPCRRELPDIIKLHQSMDPNKVAFIGINVSEQAPEGTTVTEHVAKFAEAKGITYPLVIGSEELGDAYGGIQAVPTTFIINPDGKITDQLIGGRDEATFRKALEASK
jgi:cytochrome c biogenesis protein CcmG/thiol:disulfide interchange protein DsbE